MTFAPLLMLVFLINKFVDWMRELIPDRLEPKVLIPLSWATGAALTYAFSLTVWAEEIKIGERTLASLDVVAVIVLGCILGAGGSVLNDLKPNRLSQAQMDLAVKQADTLVVEGPAVTKPVRKRKSSTR